MRQKRLWTPNEIARATAMLAAGQGYHDVDRALDRYIGATWQKFNHTEHHKKPLGAGNRSEPKCGRASFEQLADRDRRNVALDLRTQTQEFCGDPAPGYSELDRQNEARARAIFLPRQNGDR